ncbi:MAG: PDDEXK nuclease domain-containing protein [Elusimicrobiota bacterium]|jgi:predicted nuclease of restriction endonuclease-like (RecB) superfamily|nr:PDDEXK nuclease domain-containing protein [Elusimicrobiota bacterium]
MKKIINLPDTDFSKWISELKSKIHFKRNKIIYTLNAQIIEIYWDLGKDIYHKQQSVKWGSNFIDRTVLELRREFPEIKGFSRRNVYAMVQLYKFYSSKYQIVPRRVAQLPWGHNRLIVSKVKSLKEAEFYALSSINNGWDRDMLEIQIENNLYAKAGKSINNFKMLLPATQSKVAEQSLKDPYNFDFLGLENGALEKAIEDELTANITKFLLELGKGFAFVGRQYKIEI